MYIYIYICSNTAGLLLCVFLTLGWACLLVDWLAGCMTGWLTD